MKLLLVEDNQKLAKDLLDFLKDEGYVTQWADTLAKAKELVHLYSYDVIILDLGLPDGSGLDLIQLMKKERLDAGILVVSARDSLDDKLQGLDLGADDYITKPFHKAELNARIRSLIRRQKFAGNNLITAGELTLDAQKGIAFYKEHHLVLTPKEYELLVYFIYNKERVLTKENIAEHLWGDYIDLADNFDFIYNHIKNLRKKVSKAGAPDYIKSVYGIGYKFQVKD